MKLLHEACLIDGRWIDGRDRIAVDNPATGEIVGHVPALGEAETEQAIAAAQRAMVGWQQRTAADRARVMNDYYRLIGDETPALAELLSAEQGKPLAEARGEIDYAASFINWFAEEGRRSYGEIIPPHAPDRRLLVLKRPVGVVAAITPWNFPAAMVTRKIGPALAAGCGIVLKPAEQTPFTALALADLALQAGIPPGLFNVVTGDAVEIGGLLTSHPDIAKISFTGSTQTGALLMRQSASTIKKLSLELGGNAPFIVFDDADVDAAVAGAIQSKFRNAGQTCVCSNRFYVQQGVYEEFLEKFAVVTQRLHVGPATDARSEIGPLIDLRSVDKVEALVNDALTKGARCIVGGGRHALGGRYFEPTVLADVTPDMDLFEQEIFGPVAPVTAFATEAEVIGRANNTPFGLAAYAYTRDLARSWRVSEALECGIVGLNTGLISTEVAPFGGVKSSGLGREGSRHGLEDYLEIKYVCMGLYD